MRGWGATEDFVQSAEKRDEMFYVEQYRVHRRDAESAENAGAEED